MGFQSTVNEAIGTTAGITSKVEQAQQEKMKALKKKSKTTDFRNFDNKMANKSADSLKRELEGKRDQIKRIEKRRTTIAERRKQLEAIVPKIYD